MRSVYCQVFLLSLVLAADCQSALASSPVVVPLRIVGHAAIVMTRIDGVIVPLQVDSGDSTTAALQKSVLDRVRATPTGQSSKQRYIKGIVSSPWYRVHRVQIGRAVFTNVVLRLDAHPASDPAKDVGQKGFLGTGLFKTYRVVLDYPDHTMTLLSKDSVGRGRHRCAGSAVSFSSTWHGQPVTNADTDLGQVTLWWDTGAPATILSRSFIQRATPGRTPGPVTSKRFILGGTDFGPWRLAVWPMSLLPGFSGFIGYDFFSRHVVCFDFPDGEVLIQ